MAIQIVPPKSKQVAPAEDDRLMTAAQVRVFFGGVTDMTIYRWLKDTKLGFPKPIFINTNRYWRASEIEAFVKARKQAK